MKKLMALVLFASPALANITPINNSNATHDKPTATVEIVETEGSGYIYEICYRGMLFIKHKLHDTGGLTQVLDPSSGKPVQCVVKELNHG